VTSTIASLVAEVKRQLRAAEVPEPDIEARLLVQHVLRVSEEKLLASVRLLAPPGIEDKLGPLVVRRLRREPLPYILGWREFYGRRFMVDARVLIPRPETELLVERALEFAAGLRGVSPGQRGEGLRIADIGTGSGALAVTLALELPGAVVFATDVSTDAIEVAYANAIALGAADRITFLQGDLASPMEGRSDIIVANPPYVTTANLKFTDPELTYEPLLALDGGPDGLAVIRRLVAGLPRILKAGASVALIEVDPVTSAATAALARQLMSNASVEVLPDLAGLDRCLEIRPGAGPSFRSPEG